jgi:uncharacterized repeat protein (TIGR01451 family)
VVLRLCAAVSVVGFTTLSAIGLGALGASPASASGAFSNTTSIGLQDPSTTGTNPAQATVYPSTISVSGQTGTINSLSVTLSGITYSDSQALSVLLVGPNGRSEILLAGAGGANSASGVNLTLNDVAGGRPSNSSALTSGTFVPTDYNSATFPSPAPTGAYGTPAPEGSNTLTSVFQGSDPDGTWSLYVTTDFSGGGTGSISGGWSLNLTTNTPPATLYAASSPPGANNCLTPTDACTLTTALDEVGPGGTIELVTSGPAVYSGNFTVNTPGTSAGSLVTIKPYDTATPILDGGGSGTVLTVGTITPNVYLDISGVIIQHGNAAVAGVDPNGGGIFVSSGTVNVSDSTLSGNTATGYGGGIYNAGTMTLTNSTVSGNILGTYSGGAGIFNAGTMTITNSTVSGNSVDSGTEPGYGGGIFAQGTMTLTNSTVSGNSVDSGGTGGGIYVSSATVNLSATILAKNSTGANCSGSNAPIDKGYNIADDTTCGLTAGGTSSVNTTTLDASLGTLGSNGGPTQTIKLLPGSPAIDLVNSATLCATPDQRGTPRPTPVCDAGAYETSTLFTSSTPGYTAAISDAIPAGICSVDVVADGGHGYTGGAGAEVTSAVPVTPGDHLGVEVAGGGTSHAGGIGGGGGGLEGGGGGASAVSNGAGAPLVVAGGGGGGPGGGGGGTPAGANASIGTAFGGTANGGGGVAEVGGAGGGVVNGGGGSSGYGGAGGGGNGSVGGGGGGGFGYSNGGGGAGSAGGSGTHLGGTGPNVVDSGGTGNDGGGAGGAGGIGGDSSGSGGGAGGIGFGGGGGGSGDPPGGGGGAGYGGGAGGAVDGGGAGGSSYVITGSTFAPGTTSYYALSTRPGDGHVTITYDPVADACGPVVIAGATATFTGDGSAVTLDSGLTVSDAASTTLASATVTIGSYISGDTLDVTSPNGLTVSVAAGVLTLSGTASLATYQTALDSVSYSFTPSDGDPTDGGTDTSRTITWIVNDGTATSTPVTSTVDTVETRADLTIATTDNKGGTFNSFTNDTTGGTAIPGTSITYTIKVTNGGPANVVGATVSDTLPAGVSAVSWSGNGHTGTGSLSDTVSLTSGSSVTYTVSGTIASSATGSLSNTATVTPPATVTDTGTLTSSTDTVTLTPTADITITKIDDQGGSYNPLTNNTNGGTAVPGTGVTYAIIVANAGPSDVVGATVADPVPAGLSAVTWSATNGHSGTGSISDVVSVFSGTSVIYTVTGTIASSATGSLSNTATVTPPATVTDTGTHTTSTDTLTLTPASGLTITKTDNKGGTYNVNTGTTTGGTAVPGSTITYTVTVGNTGPSTATVAVTDPLAVDPAIASDTWTGDSLSGTGSISDSVTLAPGQTVVYSVTATISSSATGTLTNTATASAVDATTVLATDSVTLTPQAALSVTKTDGVSAITAGNADTYTVTVTDTGLSDATGVKVVDTLPSQGFTSVSSPNASFSTATDTWTLGTIPAGQTVTLTLSGTVPSGATGSTYANTVTASAAGATTEQVTDTDTLNEQADLTIAKTDGVPFVTAGSTDTYTITVTNAGPSDAAGVKVVDTLPSQGFTNISTIQPGGVSFSSATDTWTVGTIGASQSVTLKMTGTVPLTATGTAYTNTATVSSTTQDLNLLNNTASDTDSLSITVLPTTLPGATWESPYTSTTFSATGGAGNYTFTVTTGALPTGLVLNPTTGVLSGTPTNKAQINANVSFAVTATDSAHSTGTRSYTIAVGSPCGPGAGITPYFLTATYATGTFTGRFCVNASGTGTYTQYSPGPTVTVTATGTGTVKTSGATTAIAASGTGLALLGEKTATSSTFTETAPAPMKTGTFTFS